MLPHDDEQGFAGGYFGSFEIFLIYVLLLHLFFLGYLGVLLGMVLTSSAVVETSCI